MSLARRPCEFRLAILATLIAFIPIAIGCSNWRTVPVRDFRTNPVQLVQKRVKLYTETGVYEIFVTRIEAPYVHGRAWDTMGLPDVTVDLREVTRIDIFDGGSDVAREVFVVLGVTVAILAVIAIIAIATKESCPILYVEGDRGLVCVGEAYAGAAFASLKRDDMLPLPELRDGRVKMHLANEAHETQYTDMAKVVLAQHDPALRVVSTHKQELMLVDDSRAPLRVVDIDGTDVTEPLLKRDGRLWRSNMDAIADQKDPPLEEQLTATFPMPVVGSSPVLELRGANTYFLDLTFGRYFALMGDDLNKYLALGNQPMAASAIRQWREREGVDLRVEIQAGGGWKPVGLVTSVGPISDRDIAVPIPPELIDRNTGELKVRLRSGTGFWRFDRLGLTQAVDGALELQTLSPVVAVNDEGVDERANLQAADGKSHALRRPEERLRMVFDIPPKRPNMARSAFFFSNGYYNVHQPPESEHSPEMLAKIRDEKGAFTKFSIDLYREYLRIVRTAPPLEKKSEETRSSAQ